MKDTTKKPNQNLTKTGSRELNPFEELAHETNTLIKGTKITFDHGDYPFGESRDLMQIGTEMVVIVPSYYRGFQKWIDGKLVNANMGYVADGKKMPDETSLPDRDPAMWPLDEKTREPKDPWQRCYAVLMVRKSDDELFTFVSGSWGACKALNTLGVAYGNNIRLKPDDLPVIRLESGSRAHPDPSIKRVKEPRWPLVGWVNGAHYLTIAKSDGSGSALPTPETVF